jgi:hypothetical protein
MVGTNPTGLDKPALAFRNSGIDLTVIMRSIFFKTQEKYYF